MSVLKKYNEGTSQWEAVVLGKQGPSGTVAVTAPLTNSGTSSAAVLGVDYSALQYGQNMLLNGAFEIWQRGTSHTVTTSAFYTADRWYSSGSGGSTSCTISKQTSGSPLGIGSHARIAYNTNSAFLNIFSAFESAEVARMAGRTVTISFKARRNASFTGGINFTISTGTVADSLVSGTWTEIASASISNANLPTGTLSSDWATASATVTIPAGTVALRMRVGEDTFQPSGAYIEFTGLQVEFGSTATPFKRAGGTIQGELAACQRYYWRASADSSTTYMYMTPYNPAYNGNTIYGAVHNPVAMRRAATSVEFSGLQAADGVNPAYAVSTIVINNYSISDKISAFQVTTSSSGMTQYRCYSLRAADNAAGYLAFSAEL